MPYRERRKSVVDMLAKVPVHRGSLLRSLDDLLKTIEISESTVMIPTLLRDKCQFDAWELLFVAKILKASILGHSDLVEFYMNHMGNQASIQQHQQELNKANSSSHEQLLRNKTASNPSSVVSAQTSSQQSSQNSQQQQFQNQQSQPQTPSSDNMEITSIQQTNFSTTPPGKSQLSINNNSISNNNTNDDVNNIDSQTIAASQQQQALSSSEFHSASSSVTSNGITSWMSAATSADSSGQLQDLARNVDDATTITPTNDAQPNDTTKTNLEQSRFVGSLSSSSCHSISEETPIEISASLATSIDEQPARSQKSNQASLLIMSGQDAPVPPNRLQLPPTPSNPHDQVNGGSNNNPHSGLAESPMSLSQNNIEQLASRFVTSAHRIAASPSMNKPNSLDLDGSSQRQQICSPGDSSLMGIGLGLGNNENLSISINETGNNSTNAGLTSSDERLVRNCRSTSCLSRINSGASSPHGNNTPATANGLHPVATTPITTPVAGSLAAALSAVGSEPVADPASAPVKLLLQIEQLKTSINQVRNLLESVVELYKNSIDNLAVN